MWLMIALLTRGQFIESSVTHRFTIGAVLSSKQSREYFLQVGSNFNQFNFF